MVNYEDGYAHGMGSENSSPMLPNAYVDHNLNQIMMTSDPTGRRAMSSHN